MADEIKRVDLGFSGGQVLPLRMRADEHERLRSALDGASGWHVVKTEDSEVSIDLREVVYVRLETEKHSVGF
jgi:hypothetical protein